MVVPSSVMYVYVVAELPEIVAFETRPSVSSVQYKVPSGLCTIPDGVDKPVRSTCSSLPDVRSKLIRAMQPNSESDQYSMRFAESRVVPMGTYKWRFS